MGCGLIGTSIGLALHGGAEEALLTDRDHHSVEAAVARGAGRSWDGRERVDLAVVAVPPGQTGSALIELQSRNVAQTYTHVSSVQSHVQREVQTLSPDPSRVVGGHPLAGRELSGPSAALADLFVGRPWAVCPSTVSAPDAVEAVSALARGCGASPLLVPPEEHDAAVALSSHLPQVAASALAAMLSDTPHGPVDLRLAGPGLADTTRLAAGDPRLWLEILSANARQVAGPVRLLGDRLLGAAAALEQLAAEPGDSRAEASLRALLEEGNAGRALVPLKRGEAAGAFAGVRVSVADEPGQLAALLASAGRAHLNVEDVRVEHVPGRPRGVIELLVAPETLGPMRAALERDGWHVI